jgi:hypothetical protein
MVGRVRYFTVLPAVSGTVIAYRLAFWTMLPLVVLTCGRVARMSPPPVGALFHQSLKSRVNFWVVPSV